MSAGPDAVSCIVLHGLGASGEDLRPLAPSLYPAPNVRWRFPDAPVRPITVNGGLPMRAWYDVRGMHLLTDQDEAGISSSAELVAQLIAAEQAQGTAARRIVLAGFSQGGAMALHAGLRAAEPLAAIVALSAYLPLAEQFSAAASKQAKQTPIFMAAGQYDPVIAEHDTRASASLLSAAGYGVQMHSYPMEHAICPEEISDIAAFLAAVLAPQAQMPKKL